MTKILIAINDNLTLILTGIGIIVAITEKWKKIPFKPFTRLFKYIGNLCRDEEMHQKVDNMTNNLTELQKRHDEDEMDRLRYEILGFERTLRNLKKTETVSQEEFITIFDMVEKYHILIEKHHKMNNKFEKAQEYITEKYKIMYGARV